MNRHSYRVGRKVIVNETARKYTPDDVGETGTVIEHLDNSIYDYIVSMENGDNVKFKESELNLLPEYINGVRLVPDNTLMYNNELAHIVMIDWIHRQVEIQFESDGAYQVINFGDIEPIRKEKSD